MKKMLCRGICILLALTALACIAFAEKPLIYVSGDPDNFPIEYYDGKSKSYMGYAPSLLAAFADRYGYEIQYLDSGKTDNRASHYKNSQVDILSSCKQGEPMQDAFSDGVTFFVGDAEYRFVFTLAAGDEIKARLGEFCTAITEKQSNSIMTDVARSAQRGIPHYFAVILGIFILLFCAALVTVSVILKKNRELVKINADTDALTGVGNFSYLFRYFNQFINDKNRALYSAVYFEAHLKDSREDLNSLLKYMATELNGETWDTDILARIDNGFVFLKNCSEFLNIEEWADAVMFRLSEGIAAGSNYSSASFTAGIYPLGAYDRDLDKLIMHTEFCSRYAERHGKLHTVYSKSVEKAVKDEETLREDIKSAFREDQFTIYLQFFVDSKSKKIVGAEALSRWSHPKRGILTPANYIDILEGEQRIHELDFVVLRKVCRCLENISEKSSRPFFIACNFSRNTILRPDFVENIKSIIEKYDFPRECLLVEVTEYVRISDSETFFNNIKAVKALGVKVVIDDFGAGYTDLCDIGKANFDGIKLDKAFIDGEHTEADDIIAKALIDLMHRLNMTVISEGIESEAEAERMQRLGCRVIQGYFYYLPMPLGEAMRELYQNQQ